MVGIAIVLGAEVRCTALIFDSQFAESRLTLPAVSRVSILGLGPPGRRRQGGERRGASSGQPLVFYLGLALVVVVADAAANVPSASMSRPPRPPDALDAAGVERRRDPLPAVLFAGAMAGLGGAYLAIVSAGLFQDTLVGGRGFTADRSGDARPRPRSPSSAPSSSASLSIADWAQVEGLQHLHGRRLHAPVRPRPPHQSLRPAVVPAAALDFGMRGVR